MRSDAPQTFAIIPGESTDVKIADLQRNVERLAEVAERATDLLQELHVRANDQRIETTRLSARVVFIEGYSRGLEARISALESDNRELIRLLNELAHPTPPAPF